MQEERACTHADTKRLGRARVRYTTTTDCDHAPFQPLALLYFLYPSLWVTLWVSTYHVSVSSSPTANPLPRKHNEREITQRRARRDMHFTIHTLYDLSQRAQLRELSRMCCGCGDQAQRIKDRFRSLPTLRLKVPNFLIDH